MQSTRPLFQIDPGWLYVMAGLAMCAAGILIPVQQDLRNLQDQLETIRSRDQYMSLRLAASSNLIDRLDADDPVLIRRLAASQLNLVPGDARPVLRSSAQVMNITDWIDSSLRYEAPPITSQPPSRLARLTSGRSRLWVFGLGVLCIFFGLLLDPTLSVVARLRILKLSRKSPRREAVEAVAHEMTRSAVHTADRAPVDDRATLWSSLESETPEQRIAEEQWRAADSLDAEDLESAPLPEDEVEIEDEEVEEAEDEYEDEGEEDDAEIEDEVAPDDAEESGAKEAEDEEDDDEYEYEYVYVDVDEDDPEAAEGDDDEWEYEYVEVDEAEDGDEKAAPK